MDNVSLSIQIDPCPLKGAAQTTILEYEAGSVSKIVKLTE